MKLHIDWDRPVFPAGSVLAIEPRDLDDFYVQASDLDKGNLFFVLLTSFHHYLDKGDQPRAAHLSFLIAYYLFTPLTPPGCWPLAIHYIRRAVDLNPLPQYREWRSIIEG